MVSDLQISHFYSKQVCVCCVQKNPNIGYKTLMSGYQTKVSSLAGLKKASEVPLVVNLFQSVLDGFIRGELKRLEAADTIKVTNKTREVSTESQMLQNTFLEIKSLSEHTWTSVKKLGRYIEVNIYRFLHIPYPCVFVLYCSHVFISPSSV